jgi:hypothetical protein
LQAVPVKIRIFLLSAFFESAGDVGILLGVAEQMGVAGTSGAVPVEGLGIGGKEIAHMNAAKGRLRMRAMKFEAGIE